MLLKNSSNRETIRHYLESVSEDDLINKIIVPFYNNCGYSTLRIVDHGPGEHGKDIIFYRNVLAFYDNEYLVVQAKAQRINVGNVTEMSHQLIRALRTPITGISGGTTFFPNYVIHFNSKKISNDAHWEFPYLVDGKNNIKIISQDNICDLMLSNSIIPDELLQHLIHDQSSTITNLNIRIREILYSNKSNDVEMLFNNIIPISKNDIDINTRTMIIDFIYKTWQEDKSWSGTIIPMIWLNNCFEFIQPSQYVYLKDVLYEYNSSTPSFAAQDYTNSVFKKITIEQYKAIKNTYISFIWKYLNDYSLDVIYIQKFLQFTENTDNNDDNENIIHNSLLRMKELIQNHLKTDEDNFEYSELFDKIREISRNIEY